MEKVNVDNFRAAETALMFDNQLQMCGGMNEWFHFRSPTSVETQPVIRMNRDTLYSGAVVDLSAGARVTLPDADDRYQTVMVINEEHHINRVFDEPGTYELTMDDHGTRFVNVIARTFVDARDPADVEAVNRLQDQLVLEAGSSARFAHPAYDPETLAETRDLLKALGKGVGNTDRTFGSPAHVEPTRHLIGTAVGWGGLPEGEAYYYIATEPREEGLYTFSFGEVPVGAFWSVTIYNRDGYLEPNPFDSYNLNSVTADRDSDGSITLNLRPEGEGMPNHLYVMDGWNYALRLYKPETEVLTGEWVPPTPQLVR